MEVTLSGMVTLFRERQRKNASSPMAVTLTPPMVSGMCAAVMVSSAFIYNYNDLLNFFAIIKGMLFTLVHTYE